MPTTNTTVDDTNPLFDYQPKGAWNVRQHGYAYTYHLTYEIGATAAFNFTGTSVSLFGTKRANHGLFNVTLDGKTSTLSGYNQKYLFKQLIFSASDLENTFHTVMLANAGTKPTSNNSNVLSLDYVTFEHSTPDSGSNSNITIQATDTSFIYEPKSAWSSSTINGVLESSTNQSGASVTLNFYGQFVQIFGTTDSGTYTVSLDGSSPTTISAGTAGSHSQVLLYYQDRITSGHHNLTIVNQSVTSESNLAINYAVVDSVAPHSSSKTLSGGVIAGIVIGGLVAIVILFGALIFVWKRIHLNQDDDRSSQKSGSILPRQSKEDSISKSKPYNQLTSSGYYRYG